MTKEITSTTTEENGTTSAPENVESTEPKVETETTPAGEPATDGEATETTTSTEGTESADDSEKAADEDVLKDDPDVIPDDEEIKNMGQLRKAWNRNKSLTDRLRTALEENKALKETQSGQTSEADTSKIAELEAKLATYEEKEAELVKKEALREAGLPENLIKTLKGDDKEWREVLDIHKENYNNFNQRLGSDRVTNGLGDKYKTDSSTSQEILERAKILSSGRFK